MRRRRRLVGLARLVVFALVLTLSVWTGVRVAHAGHDGRLYSGTTYQVRAGDTLWGIAARAYDDVDLRAAMYHIRQANGLSPAACLQPGAVLTLPYLEE